MSRNFYQKKNSGQAMILAVILFLTIAIIFTVGVMVPIVDEMRLANNLILSDSSYYAGESGVEDVTYRLKDGLTVPSNGIDNITLTTASSTATSSTTFTAVSGGEQIDATGNQSNLYRNLQVTLASGSGAAFQYGAQTGVGGIEMVGSAEINGSVYTAGTVSGSNNIITGDVISAGPSGLITSPNGQYNPIDIQGNAYAHTIQDAHVSKNAYYQSITTSTVSGTSYPGSSDKSLPSLPISDTQIDAWETQAQSGGVSGSCSGGTYTIQGTSNVTLGPIEIPCNLTITASAQVTVAGPIWVKGDFTVSGSAIVKGSSSLGSNSVQIIADNPSNDSTSAEVNIGSSGQLTGSGNSQSFMLVVSQNNSTQNGGSQIAIDANGSATGNYTVYAGHGEVELDGSANLIGAIGYLLYLTGATEVTYNSNLSDMTFSSSGSGSSGGYTISSWGETQ